MKTHFDSKGAALRRAENIQHYFKAGLKKITEEERRANKDYSYVRDLPPALIDRNIQQIIHASPTLGNYFNLGADAPPMLDGEKYKVIAEVGSGRYGKVVLAEEDGTGEEVIIKVPLKRTTPQLLKAILTEYMYQELACIALKHTVTVPEPLGIIRQQGDEHEGGYRYLVVSQFVPLLPGFYASFPIDYMIKNHNTKEFVRLIEWENICLNLIKAVEELYKNDLYHLDLHCGNVMIEIADNSIQPVIIDFGTAMRRDSRAGRRGSIFKAGGHTPEERKFLWPQIAPELYDSVIPLPTSDLYGVSSIIMFIAKAVKLPIVTRYINTFRDQEPANRDMHDVFFEKIKQAFTEERGSGVIVIDDDTEGERPTARIEERGMYSGYTL